MVDLNLYFKKSSERVETFLDNYLKDYSSYIAKLNEGMRYSLFAGGKRLRPALVYATYNIYKEDLDNVTPFAAAVEVIHTYSLIHDDLPSMDDDDMRRGKPSNHVAFGEAEAILAGDALLTKAFEIISDPNNGSNFSDAIRLRSVFELAKFSGDNGMVGGQFADLKAENSPVNESLVEFIHSNKTSALIRSAILLGGICGGASEEDLKSLSDFGLYSGLAFQIKDDVLDLVSSSHVLGKSVNKDLYNNKATYPVIFGIEDSVKVANKYIEKALDSIKDIKNKDTLVAIAKFMTERHS